jgi:hypothetical protein
MEIFYRGDQLCEAIPVGVIQQVIIGAGLQQNLSIL